MMAGCLYKLSVWTVLATLLAAGAFGGAVDRAAFEAALMHEEGAGAQPPLRIVLLADKKDHGPTGNGLHDYPLWQERWALLLGGYAASDAAQVNLHGPAVTDVALGEGAPGVSVERARGWPSDAQFAAADVIVAFCYLSWNDARKKQVDAYLARGGGVVAIHSAAWTLPKADPAVAERLGVGGFARYRHGEVRVETVVPDHPVCRNLPQTVMLDDETYWPPIPPVDTARVTVLAVCREKNEKGVLQPQPMLWTFEPGKGRVFGCVPGHSAATFDDPWFRLAVLRGIAWAAGGSPYRFDRLAPRGARFNGPKEK
ncbi:MAG TPA: ThuA domain-containing protein [Kiritimatiellia bacterium]|nr:ThuA domain-containing protein [Kiritimatiellia bacterium]HRU69759.1 ThuA domain-containing protein [Kiritimatiellia bacterium]